MFMVKVGYPVAAEEIEILKRTTGDQAPEVKPLFSAAEILQLQRVVRRVPVAEHVYEYVVNLVHSTPARRAGRARSRPSGSSGAPALAPASNSSWAAKPAPCFAAATMSRTEDIAALAKPVLRHRIICNFAAQAGGLTTDLLIERLRGPLSEPEEPQT